MGIIEYGVRKYPLQIISDSNPTFLIDIGSNTICNIPMFSIIRIIIKSNNLWVKLGARWVKIIDLHHPVNTWHVWFCIEWKTYLFVGNWIMYHQTLPSSNFCFSSLPLSPSLKPKQSLTLSHLSVVNPREIGEDWTYWISIVEVGSLEELLAIHSGSMIVKIFLIKYLFKSE